MTSALKKPTRVSMQISASAGPRTTRSVSSSAVAISSACSMRPPPARTRSRHAATPPWPTAHARGAALAARAHRVQAGVVDHQERAAQLVFQIDVLHRPQLAGGDREARVVHLPAVEVVHHHVGVGQAEPTGADGRLAAGVTGVQVEAHGLAGVCRHGTRQTGECLVLGVERFAWKGGFERRSDRGPTTVIQRCDDGTNAASVVHRQRKAWEEPLEVSRETFAVHGSPKGVSCMSDVGQPPPAPVAPRSPSTYPTRQAR